MGLGSGDGPPDVGRRRRDAVWFQPRAAGGAVGGVGAARAREGPRPVVASLRSTVQRGGEPVGRAVPLPGRAAGVRGGAGPRLRHSRCRGARGAGDRAMADITEQSEAEEKLKRSEATTRALLDAVPDLMFGWIERDATWRAMRRTRGIWRSRRGVHRQVVHRGAAQTPRRGVHGGDQPPCSRRTAADVRVRGGSAQRPHAVVGGPGRDVRLR